MRTPSARVLVLVLALLSPVVASAQPLPAPLAGVGVEPRAGAHIPTDLVFNDTTGRRIRFPWTGEPARKGELVYDHALKFVLDAQFAPLQFGDRITVWKRSAAFFLKGRFQLGVLDLESFQAILKAH